MRHLLLKHLLLKHLLLKHHLLKHLLLRHLLLKHLLVYELISTKARTYEDRSISTLGYEVATFTYPEYDWGPNNGVPQIVLEFDVTNSYLLTAQITYNRREANNKILAFNSRDLQQRLIDEFNDMKIWDAAGEDHSAMALAIDRRRALEDEEEAEEAEE